MHVVFRVDASSILGRGHVARCLTLAGAHQAAGATVLFVCAEHAGHLCDLITSRGFPVARIPVTARPDERPDGVDSASFTVRWEDDAHFTHAAIDERARRADWLVVDHYSLDWRWERAMRTDADRIFVIEDLPDREHDCDLLLDQNLIGAQPAELGQRVPAGCVTLIGPRYALLSPEYADLHDRVPPRNGSVKRILGFFSGGDIHNVTARCVTAFASLGREDVRMDVVVAGGASQAAAIGVQIAAHPNIHVFADLPSLAPLMCYADLAIGASGVTSWERCCLGLPAIVISMGENQRSIASALDRHELAVWLGHADAVDESTLASEIQRLLELDSLEDWSRRCAAAVDGRGAARVVAAMTVTASTPLEVRPAQLRDERFALRAVRSDASGWFRTRLREIADHRVYIAMAGSESVGLVSFSRAPDGWQVLASVDPVYDGRLLERPATERAMSAFRASERGALRFSSPQAGGSRGLRLSICSGNDSWINAYIPQLILDWLDLRHEVSWVTDAGDLSNGDVCVLLGYERLVRAEELARHRNNLVVHESDLPAGRGWSPLTWQVLEGASAIPVTLFEASDSIDSGPVYLRERIELVGNELVTDLRRLQFAATARLCVRFIDAYPGIVATATAQVGDPTFYRRRVPDDSALDPDRPLRDQLNLLRVVDNVRYPAWILLNGRKCLIHIEACE